MIVIIPAYQPDEKLVKLVADLKSACDYPIVVVNDGSNASCDPIFSAIADRVTLLTHEVNSGKGAALKTAYRYIAEHYPVTEGVVTVDADGQHLPADIIRVSEAWARSPEKLVLGSRKFTGSVPWKSRTGNAITRFVFALSTGVKVYDTQTGLRAFSVSRIPMMLEMKGDRYEYEINVLLYATRENIPIEEVTIETVYIEDNKSSHFHPIRDAWRIYKMILLFAASSLAAAIIDYILVLVFSAILAGLPQFPLRAQSLLISVVAARVISSLANYLINRKIVFESREKSSILRYFALAVGILIANYCLLYGVTLFLPLAVGKILVELILYPLSFYLQRKWVFPVQSEVKKA